MMKQADKYVDMDYAASVKTLTALRTELEEEQKSLQKEIEQTQLSWNEERRLAQEEAKKTYTTIKNSLCLYQSHCNCNGCQYNK